MFFEKVFVFFFFNNIVGESLQVCTEKCIWTKKMEGRKSERMLTQFVYNLWALWIVKADMLKLG